MCLHQTYATSVLTLLRLYCAHLHGMYEKYKGDGDSKYHAQVKETLGLLPYLWKFLWTNDILDLRTGNRTVTIEDDVFATTLAWTMTEATQLWRCSQYV